MINFNFLTPFQLATFVLGIVFSILTIGMVFYTLRHPRGYRSNVLKVIFTFILPAATIIMWFMCIFAAYEIFESELYTILLSMGCGAAVSGLTYLIAWLINRSYGKTSNEEEAEELKEIEEEVAAELEAEKEAEKEAQAKAEAEANAEENQETAKVITEEIVTEEVVTEEIITEEKSDSSEE